MIVAKINKIKNLGLVFPDYTWDSNLHDFKKFNLVYGWNGSGKTTLTRLFDALNGVTISGLEYQVEVDDNNRYKQGQDFPIKVRVFNQDYIKNNIGIHEGRANSITLVLGEENKELAKKVESDKLLLSGDPSKPSVQGKISKLKKFKEDKTSKEKERGEKFTGIGKTIGAAIAGDTIRKYIKTHAEKDFSMLKGKSELSHDDLNNASNAVKQRSLPELTVIKLPKFENKENASEDEVDKILNHIHSEATLLLKNTVESEIISRLDSHEDISTWVESGIQLHQKHSSKVCEYCQQDIPVERNKQLARHFNEADKQLKTKIDDLLDVLRKAYKVIESLSTPDRARFYANLQKDFDEALLKYKSSQKQILSTIEILADELKSKKSLTTQHVDLKTQLNIVDFMDQIDSVNKIIGKHGQITANFEDIKKKETQNLKDHYLSTIYDDVNKLEGEIVELDKSIESTNKEVEEIEERISKNLAQISNQHKACEQINEKLAIFLGHQELNFSPYKKDKTEEDEDSTEVIEGYEIKRGKKLAEGLSEGEKTAIAFVYFIVHLGDHEFDSKNGIVVIDDPISSLDSNSLFQAFSFLKNAVKDCGQVFVLTHNFDFLKLLINWRRNVGGAGYYMIKNGFQDDSRSAYLDKMDKELYKYESEYHYLFKLLKECRDEQDGTIEKAYPVPNIARKVWDTFLMFRVPNGKTVYNKMEELKADGYNNEKLDSIYKFTNVQSHITGSGFDPALVPGAKTVIKELFEIMEEASPEHFKIIDEATN